MAVIIRLQNLSWSASAPDIRKFFSGLTIPNGGVHIVGGDDGDCFVAFATDEDARKAMKLDGGKLANQKIKLQLSSKAEMEDIIAVARGEKPLAAAPAPPQPQLSAAKPHREVSRHRSRSRSPRKGTSPPSRGSRNSRRESHHRDSERGGGRRSSTGHREDKLPSSLQSRRESGSQGIPDGSRESQHRREVAKVDPLPPPLSAGIGQQQQLQQHQLQQVQKQPDRRMMQPLQQQSASEAFNESMPSKLGYLLPHPSKPAQRPTEEPVPGKKMPLLSTGLLQPAGGRDEEKWMSSHYNATDLSKQGAGSYRGTPPPISQTATIPGIDIVTASIGSRGGKGASTISADNHRQVQQRIGTSSWPPAPMSYSDPRPAVSAVKELPGFSRGAPVLVSNGVPTGPMTANVGSSGRGRLGPTGRPPALLPTPADPMPSLMSDLNASSSEDTSSLMQMEPELLQPRVQHGPQPSEMSHNAFPTLSATPVESTLRLLNLTPYTTKKALCSFFAAHGVHPLDVKLIKHWRGEQGMGYALFSNTSESSMVLNELNEIIVDGIGEPIRFEPCSRGEYDAAVEHAAPLGSGQRGSNSQLCVTFTDLPPSAQAKDLEALLDGTEYVTPSLYVEYDPASGQCTGAAYVEMGHTADYETVLGMRKRVSIHGQIIRVRPINKEEMKARVVRHKDSVSLLRRAAAAAAGDFDSGDSLRRSPSAVTNVSGERRHRFMGGKGQPPLVPDPLLPLGPPDGVGGHDRPGVVLHLTGLPADCDPSRLMDFLQPAQVDPNFVRVLAYPDGLCSGEAFVKLFHPRDVDAAMQRDMAHWGAQVVRVWTADEVVMSDVIRSFEAQISEYGHAEPLHGHDERPLQSGRWRHFDGPDSLAV